jgi:hypothetical protein
VVTALKPAAIALKPAVTVARPGAIRSNHALIAMNLVAADVNGNTARTAKARIATVIKPS